MHFCLVHLDDACGAAGEEVYVVVPGSKTAMAVPLDALPEFLPLLERAVGGKYPPECQSCAAAIPKLAVSPGPQCQRGAPG